MSKVPMTLACAAYDRTRALAEGTVQPNGIDLTYLALPVGEIFRRQLFHKEFEVSEMSMSNLVTLVARGQRDLVGIPIFPSRIFRHNSIFVNVDAGIDKPQDLIGRKMGVPDYTITAALFMRGLLQHEYDVHPTQMDWYWGGMNAPDAVQRVKFALPEGLRLTHIGPNRNLNDMLIDGELDAIMVAGAPRAYLESSPKVRRLFPNYKEVERDYYKRTGICPIMHTITMRADIYDRYRWAARSLYDAFCEAKEQCAISLEQFGAPKAMLVWLPAAIEDERAVFGHDWWQYGISAQRKTLEALVQYSYEQGLSVRKVEVEELFVPELRDT